MRSRRPQPRNLTKRIERILALALPGSTYMRISQRELKGATFSSGLGNGTALESHKENWKIIVIVWGVTVRSRWNLTKRIERKEAIREGLKILSENLTKRIERDLFILLWALLESQESHKENWKKKYTRTIITAWPGLGISQRELKAGETLPMKRSSSGSRISQRELKGGDIRETARLISFLPESHKENWKGPRQARRRRWTSPSNLTKRIERLFVFQKGRK